MKILLLFIFSFTIINTVNGQRFGYIDSEIILSKMTEYKEAQDELNKLTVNWQEQITAMKDEVTALKDKYRSTEVTLTKEMKDIRLKEIDEKENEMLEYQDKAFGYEGLLFSKRLELIKPVQDKIFKAVEKVAKAKKLQIIFDKSADLVMVYTDPVHNYTDYVLEELGYGDPADKPDGK